MIDEQTWTGWQNCPTNQVICGIQLRDAGSVWPDTVLITEVYVYCCILV